MSVSPRTLCLHDERNARKNCEVKTLRLVCEQPLTSIFPCVDSTHFILSALNSAHDSPPESTHASLANVSDGELSLHTSLCLDAINCTIVLLVHDGAFALLDFRRGKKAKTHTNQAPLPLYTRRRRSPHSAKHMLPIAPCHLCSLVGADRPPKQAMPVARQEDLGCLCVLWVALSVATVRSTL